MCDGAAEKVTECATNRDAEHKQSKDAGAAVGRKEVAEPAGGGGGADGFTNANAHAGEEQDGEGRGDAGGGGEGGPDNDAEGEQFLARPRVGDAPERDAYNSVDPNEDPAEEADLRICEAELFTHGFDKGPGGVAVIEVEDVDEEEDSGGKEMARLQGVGIVSQSGLD